MRFFITEQSAERLQRMHPLRLDYELSSDRNPFMQLLEFVRKITGAGAPLGAEAQQRPANLEQLFASRAKPGPRKREPAKAAAEEV